LFEMISRNVLRSKKAMSRKTITDHWSARMAEAAAMGHLISLRSNILIFTLSLMSNLRTLTFTCKTISKMKLVSIWDW